MGSERGKAHRAWYRTLAEHYDRLYDPRRVQKAYPFLHAILRRHGPAKDLLDVACGTFALDLPLVRRGYRVVGRDLSADMLRVARRNLANAGRTADLGESDMRTLHLNRTFDAVLCLGSAFNYLVTAADARAALRTFRNHLRPGGVLILDLTNFDAWIRRPKKRPGRNGLSGSGWHSDCRLRVQRAGPEAGPPLRPDDHRPPKREGYRHRVR